MTRVPKTFVLPGTGIRIFQGMRVRDILEVGRCPICNTLLCSDTGREHLKLCIGADTAMDKVSIFLRVQELVMQKPQQTVLVSVSYPKPRPRIPDVDVVDLDPASGNSADVLTCPHWSEPVMEPLVSEGCCERDFSLIRQAVWDSDSDAVICVGVRETLFLLASHFQTLRPDEWLNDEIVNSFGLRAVMGNPRVRFLNSFALSDRGISSYEKFICYKEELLLVPFYENRNHWVLTVWNKPEREMKVYDSLWHTSKGISSVLSEACKVLDNLIPGHPWRIVIAEDAPKQRNGVDCGIFVSALTELIAGFGSSSNVTALVRQSHMLDWRTRLAGRIIFSCRLPRRELLFFRDSHFEIRQPELKSEPVPFSCSSAIMLVLNSPSLRDVCLSSSTSRLIICGFILQDRSAFKQFIGRDPATVLTMVLHNISEDFDNDIVWVEDLSRTRPGSGCQCVITFSYSETIARLWEPISMISIRQDVLRCILKLDDQLWRVFTDQFSAGAVLSDEDVQQELKTACVIAHMRIMSKKSASDDDASSIRPFKVRRPGVGSSAGQSEARNPSPSFDGNTASPVPAGSNSSADDQQVVPGTPVRGTSDVDNELLDATINRAARVLLHNKAFDAKGVYTSMVQQAIVLHQNLVNESSAVWDNNSTASTGSDSPAGWENLQGHGLTSAFSKGKGPADVEGPDVELDEDNVVDWGASSSRCAIPKGKGPADLEGSGLELDGDDVVDWGFSRTDASESDDSGSDVSLSSSSGTRAPLSDLRVPLRRGLRSSLTSISEQVVHDCSDSNGGVKRQELSGSDGDANNYMFSVHDDFDGFRAVWENLLALKTDLRVFLGRPSEALLRRMGSFSGDMFEHHRTVHIGETGYLHAPLFVLLPPEPIPSTASQRRRSHLDAASADDFAFFFSKVVLVALERLRSWATPFPFRNTSSHSVIVPIRLVQTFSAHISELCIQNGFRRPLFGTCLYGMKTNVESIWNEMTTHFAMPEDRDSSTDFVVDIASCIYAADRTDIFRNQTVLFTLQFLKSVFKSGEVYPNSFGSDVCGDAQTGKRSKGVLKNAGGPVRAMKFYSTTAHWLRTGKRVPLQGTTFGILKYLLSAFPEISYLKREFGKAHRRCCAEASELREGLNAIAHSDHSGRIEFTVEIRHAREYLNFVRSFLAEMIPLWQSFPQAAPFVVMSSHSFAESMTQNAEFLISKLGLDDEEGGQTNAAFRGTGIDLKHRAELVLANDLIPYGVSGNPTHAGNISLLTRFQKTGKPFRQFFESSWGGDTAAEISSFQRLVIPATNCVAFSDSLPHMTSHRIFMQTANLSDYNHIGDRIASDLQSIFDAWCAHQHVPVRRAVTTVEEAYIIRNNLFPMKAQQADMYCEVPFWLFGGWAYKAWLRVLVQNTSPQLLPLIIRRVDQNMEQWLLLHTVYSVFPILGNKGTVVGWTKICRRSASGFQLATVQFSGVDVQRKNRFVEWCVKHFDPDIPERNLAPTCAFVTQLMSGVYDETARKGTTKHILRKCKLLQLPAVASRIERSQYLVADQRVLDKLYSRFCLLFPSPVAANVSGRTHEKNALGGDTNEIVRPDGTLQDSDVSNPTATNELLVLAANATTVVLQGNCNALLQISRCYEPIPKGFGPLGRNQHPSERADVVMLDRPSMIVHAKHIQQLYDQGSGSAAPEPIVDAFLAVLRHIKGHDYTFLSLGHFRKIAARLNCEGLGAASSSNILRTKGVVIPMFNDVQRKYSCMIVDFENKRLRLVECGHSGEGCLSTDPDLFWRSRNRPDFIVRKWLCSLRDEFHPAAAAHANPLVGVETWYAQYDFSDYRDGFFSAAAMLKVICSYTGIETPIPNLFGQSPKGLSVADFKAWAKLIAKTIAFLKDHPEVETAND